MVCKVLEQVIECFGAAITKKPHFLPKNSKKKCFSNALRHTLVVLEMH